MKICVPSQSEPHLDARLSQHFGHAPWFVVFDNDTGELEMVAKGEEHYDGGHCVVPGSLMNLRIEAVVCGGMGKKSLVRFEDQGMAVFLSPRERVWEVLADIRAGDVKRLTLEDACESHCQHG